VVEDGVGAKVEGELALGGWPGGATAQAVWPRLGNAAAELLQPTALGPERFCHSAAQQVVLLGGQVVPEECGLNVIEGVRHVRTGIFLRAGCHLQVTRRLGRRRSARPAAVAEPLGQLVQR
jgi:hypothetical protein